MKKITIYTIGCMAIVSPVIAEIPSFVGDLVGRDLIGAHPLGHVGIGSAPDYRMRPTVILEAMSNKPHIQENTIDNFKSRSKFWGSKGGLLTPKSYQSYTVANRIVRQYYSCPEYSYTWKWREGKAGKNNQFICAIFRCDTLVNYAYAFSEGYSLPTYNTIWTTPVAIYNYFPVDSDLLIPERSTNQLNSEYSATSNENINSINENNVKELDEEHFYQLFQNSPNISEKQIRYLWGLFISNEVDSKVRILFYDFLSFETPNYLINEIITQAKNEHGELRHKLLVLLQSIYQQNLENNETIGINEILDYFKELQSQKLNKDDAGIVYRGLVTLAPKYVDIKTANMTNMDKIHISLLNIKNNPKNEIKYVREIIYNLDHPDDRLVVTASYKYIAELLINSDLSFLSLRAMESRRRGRVVPGSLRAGCFSAGKI